MGATRQVQLAIVRAKPISGKSKLVYDLVCKSYISRKPLNTRQVCRAYANSAYDSKKTMTVREYNVKGKWVVKKMSARERLFQLCMDKATYRSIAISWFKYHIGNLVLNGYSIIQPVINDGQ